MNKSQIRVVKRDDIGTEGNAEAMTSDSISEHQELHNIKTTIDGWISEQRSKRKSEVDYSNGRIEGWKRL
jgi:hypothetical protein